MDVGDRRLLRNLLPMYLLGYCQTKNYFYFISFLDHLQSDHHTVSYHNTIKKQTSIQFQVVFFDFHSSGAENARHSVSSCLDGPSTSVWTQFAVNSPHSQFPSQFASSSFLHSQIAHNFSQIVVQNQKYKNSSPFLPTVESRLAQPPMVGEWWPSKAKANSLARIFWRLTGISDPNRKRPKTITSLVPTHFQNRNKFQRITPV